MNEWKLAILIDLVSQYYLSMNPSIYLYKHIYYLLSTIMYHYESVAIFMVFSLILRLIVYINIHKYTSIHLSIYPPIHPFIHVYIHVYIYASILKASI